MILSFRSYWKSSVSLKQKTCCHQSTNYLCFTTKQQFDDVTDQYQQMVASCWSNQFTAFLDKQQQVFGWDWLTSLGARQFKFWQFKFGQFKFWQFKFGQFKFWQLKFGQFKFRKLKFRQLKFQTTQILDNSNFDN